MDASENGHKPIVHAGPSRRFTLADVAAVATGAALLEIEPAALEALPSVPPDASAAAMVAAAQSLTPAATGDAALTPREARAVLVARVVSLVQGRAGVRREAAAALAEALNAGIAPAGLPRWKPEAIAEAVAAIVSAGFPTGGLTPQEVKALKTGTFPVMGPAALVGHAVAGLVPTADMVAAVSCEAGKASIDPFQAVHFDINRPHRGQMACAASLRLCLEGSTLVRQGKEGDGKDGEGEEEPAALRCIPQIHGPCREAVDAGVKALELELNSAEACGAGGGIGSYHPAQVEVTVGHMQNALAVLLRASNARLQLLKQPAQASNGVDELLDGGLLASVPTPEKAVLALAEELSEALTQLSTLEAAAAAAAAEAAKAKEARAAEAQQGQRGGAGGKEEDLEGMDPAKRAKIEAARKAKAEKAAAKAAAKAAKQGRGALVLGVGVREFKDWLQGKNGGDGATAAAALAPHLDPLAAPGFDGQGACPAFCRALVERLGSGGQLRKPKIAKGTRDFGEEQMLVREEAFGIIRRIFKLHGAREIDTPVFELKETLTGKYGEDSKLIYDLADQGGELLSLRYDLTVPFARYLAMYNPGNLKRFHIAKVYRRDNPAMARGRFREFYQCDFDIAGSYPTMVPDAEVITVAVEILSSLPIGPFEIKLNHRRLLDSIFEICGVPPEKFRTICSAVDKLDKEPWEEVRREMTEEKGLKGSVADKIGTFVTYKGPPQELHAKLVSEGIFGEHAGAKAALDELAILFSYLEAMDSLKAISFDLSLARGLDYYTGVIYEAVLTAKDSVVGSIAAGGRYDNLVGMFSASGQQTPCVGVSIGIERVLTIMEARKQQQAQQELAQQGRRRSPFVEVLVATIGADMLPQRMRLARQLWAAGIPAEYLPQDNPKLKKQMEYAHEAGIPFLVIVGSDELKKGVVKVKDPSKPQEESEEEVPVEQMAANLISKGARVVRRPHGHEEAEA